MDNWLTPGTTSLHCFTIPAILVLTCLSQTIAHGEEEIAKIAQAWRSKSKDIRTVEFRIEGRGVLPKGGLICQDIEDEDLVESAELGRILPAHDYHFPWKYRLIVDLQNGRVARQSSAAVLDMDTKKCSTDHRVDTFDGFTAMKCEPKANRLSINGRFQVYSSINELFITLGMLDAASRGPSLSKDFDLSKYHIAGTRDYRGMTCTVLQQGDDANSCTQLWLDPKRDYCVVRKTRTSRGLLRSDVQMEYELQPEGYLLSQIQQESFSHLTAGLSTIRKTGKVKVVLNGHHPDKTFVIKPKPGMIVYDYATDQSTRIPHHFLGQWTRTQAVIAALAVGIGVLVIYLMGRRNEAETSK